MTAEVLKTQTKEEVMNFIRETLSFKELSSHIRDDSDNFFQKQHLRFDMSGYESVTGACTVNNINLLNKFAFLGIYDYTEYLFLDFYKGIPRLYLKYWNDINIEIDEWSGLGTTEIIYKIFELTIFTDKTKRRRY